MWFSFTPCNKSSVCIYIHQSQISPWIIARLCVSFHNTAHVTFYTGCLTLQCLWYLRFKILVFEQPQNTNFYRKQYASHSNCNFHFFRPTTEREDWGDIEQFQLIITCSADLKSVHFFILNPKHTGSGQICPPILISSFLSKILPRNIR